MDNILFPNDTEELRRIKEEFYDMAQVPNVVGAIDGTLIPIQGMSSDDEHVYVCRKGFHSLNIKAVVDAKMRCSHKTEGSLPYKPLKCSRIIETCFRLHNKAIEARVPLIQGGEVRHVYQNNVHNHQPNRDAQALRQRIISRF
ncbi:hypothetical protein LOTGIDRAFT_173581 [Lottia gigantea]|uniref:DDE Tnp4 domain-containing protein n=1 Tax=Lottia gigantea TaxID=225164 RepID=V4B0M0_LOTGI|nr:hypothetical protein LOTGIDRAFT_173581 [Lottia gigantea]ESO99696.1 hypothetical protein LOTGIDRAFT_173581 [Lottia gigantea]